MAILAPPITNDEHDPGQDLDTGLWTPLTPPPMQDPAPDLILYEFLGENQDLVQANAMYTPEFDLEEWAKHFYMPLTRPMSPTPSLSDPPGTYDWQDDKYTSKHIDQIRAEGSRTNESGSTVQAVILDDPGGVAGSSTTASMASRHERMVCPLTQTEAADMITISRAHYDSLILRSSLRTTHDLSPAW